MYNLKPLLLVGILFVFSFQIKSQTSFDSVFTHFRNLSIKGSTDSEKTIYSDSLRNYVKAFFNTENSFNQPLGKIPYMGDVYSPDSKFRIITWNISLKNGSYDYVCFIQTSSTNYNKTNWYELTDQHKTINRPESKSLNKDNWYGSLYYSIIPFKKDKKTHYVILGWEGNNRMSNKKVMECLSFNKKLEPIFNQSVFESTRFSKKRIVFEYSKEAYFMLRYNEKLKQIVFNRLEPIKPELEGIFSFYQPTMLYDAYQLKKGKWTLKEDVNPRNKKNNKEFHNPSDLKRQKNK